MVVDGVPRTYLSTKAPLRDGSGEVIGLIATSTDITERVAMEEKQKLTRERLEAREAMLKIARNLTKAGTFEWEIEADRVGWSDELYRIFGLEPGEIPPTFEGYLEPVHPDEREERRNTIAGWSSRASRSDGEHRIVRPDGEVRWVESRIRPLIDESGRPILLLGVCQDVTERKHTTLQLKRDMEAAEERALHDPSPACQPHARPRPARARIRLRHEARCQPRGAVRRHRRLQARQRPLRATRRRLGPRAVAERMRNGVRGSDTVARIGGDEFLVICEQASGTFEALETAERLHEAFKSPFEVRGFAGKIEISIGASTIGGRNLTSADDLVAEADAAMYETKRRGPGGLALRDSGDGSRS